MNTPFAYTDAKPKQRSRLVSIGAVLIVVGVLAAIVSGFLGWRNLPDTASFPRVSGQSQPIELTAGEWTVFAEGGGVARPTAIVDPNGQSVAIGSQAGSQNYDLGGFSGVAVGKVNLPVDGVYLVSTAPGETVAFSQSFATSLIASIGLILAAVFIGGGLVAIGLLLLIIGLVKGR